MPLCSGKAGQREGISCADVALALAGIGFAAFVEFGTPRAADVERSFGWFAFQASPYVAALVLALLSPFWRALSIAGVLALVLEAYAYWMVFVQPSPTRRRRSSTCASPSFISRSSRCSCWASGRGIHVADERGLAACRAHAVDHGRELVRRRGERIGLGKLLARPVAPEHASRACSVAAGCADVVRAVADHDRRGGIHAFLLREVCEEIGLVVEATGEVGAVDRREVVAKAELDDAAREDVEGLAVQT